MDEPTPGQIRFTIRELMVLVAIVAIGLAIIVPLLRTSNEQSNRVQCTNNLKSIGVGVHNFHDIRQEIPPSYVTDDNSPSARPSAHVSWPVGILPFIESNDVYQWIDLCEPLSSDRTASQIVNHQFVRTTSIPTYFCPTRRNAPLLTANGECSVGDYASVSRADLPSTVVPTQPRSWDAAMLPSRFFNPSRSNATIGGIGLRPGDYRSMTTFADVIDGLSNTAFIGEKAIQRDRLGGDKNTFADTVKAGQQDGTFYYGKGGNPADLIEPGEMAYWSRRLAPANATDRLLPLRPRLEDPRNRFGGWHHGVTMFLLGDGSVRAVNNATSPLLLQRLGCRNDRETFDLP